MAVRATGGFGIVRYEPGNPEFPTLPDGIVVPHLVEYGRAAGLGVRAPVRTRRVLGAAPNGEEQQYAGWQTDTTWINPSVVDFGVIPSPVQRTVSLYNARSTPVIVTALTLPSGVTLVSPSLPVTLNPYAGVTFTLEAGTTGDNAFDEFHTFTTDVGDVTFRILGRRVFGLEVIPETPMRETLVWKTDILRSNDGSEKVYSLLQAPSVVAEYQVKFRDDIQRIKFKNNFIAGESALVVSGQKWYEARRLLNAAGSSDTTLDVDTPTLDASWTIGGPLAVVTEDGSAYSAQLDSYRFQPDEYIENVVMLLRFEGVDGSQSTVDSSQYENEVRFFPAGNPEISTDQAKFGSASYFGGTSFPSFTLTGAEVAYHPSIDFGSDDFTIDMWLRGNASDIASNKIVLARWEAGGGPGRLWTVNKLSSGIRFQGYAPTLFTIDFPFGSPIEMQVDTWHYLRLNRVGNSLYCFIDGVQIGAIQPFNVTWGVLAGSPEMTTIIGNYYDGGFVAPWQGYIDDVRITVGAGRSTEDFTPPTERHPDASEMYLELTLGADFGAEAPADSFIMPAGLGYVSKFPEYTTYQLNLETADYELIFNQEADYSSLDTDYFPTLTDLQSPANTLPVLEFCNETSGRTKSSGLNRDEDPLDSGLSNRIAFSEFPFGEHVSDFRLTINDPTILFKWRQFFHYLRGSYGEFFVPTFTNDMPGVTTAASNVFDITDQDLTLLFGNPPDPRRNAIRLVYPNGNVYYRMITQVIDNVATEEVTVNSAVEAGSPFISYLQRCRILGDTVTFEHRRIDDVILTFKFRTILL